MKIFQFTANRQDLLAQISAFLASDNRFPAAWLAGSFGMGEADNLSDLDLSVVVAEPDCWTLCARPAMTGAGTTPERLALFSLFGQPAVIHENHHNAPEGGTFTFVLYRQTGLNVDWILIPRPLAQRPAQSLLLIDKASIPFQSPPEPGNPARRAELASERAAFFWMLLASSVKFILRKDAVGFYCLIGMLDDTLDEIRRLLVGRPAQYRRRPPIPFATSLANQKALLRRYCLEAGALMPSITAMGGQAPVSPLEPIDILLDLAED